MLSTDTELVLVTFIFLMKDSVQLEGLDPQINMNKCLSCLGMQARLGTLSTFRKKFDLRKGGGCGAEALKP